MVSVIPSQVNNEKNIVRISLLAPTTPSPLPPSTDDNDIWSARVYNSVARSLAGYSKP
jgi:hypothetical protein